MPKIAIDYTPAYEQGGGIGRYVRDLVTALSLIDNQNDYRLFISGASQPTLPNQIAHNFNWKPTRIPPKWFARLWHRLKIPLPVEQFTGRIDLYHATDFVLPPTLPSTKTLLTVHDLSFVRVPETASPSLKAYLDRVVPLSVKRADHILADSQATKNDLIELYAVKSKKISVLLTGVDKRFKPSNTGEMTIRNKYSVGDRPYLFTIGTVQPRKNYARIIQSLAKLREEGHDLDLVIAGGHGWLADPIYQTIQETQMTDYVKLIGFADDEDIPTLYTNAECVVFPSLYEGFGYPVLEGMACGTPVITSNISSLPEVAGDAALMVNPYDVDAITNAIRSIITDDELRKTLTERGFEQIKHFTWEKSAQQLHQIYTDLLTGNLN